MSREPCPAHGRTAGTVQLRSTSTSCRNSGLDASDAAVEEAARQADAHAFVSALPDGYATRLGERGTRLSAGQRVALARAFLRAGDADLVLLDEPTAHLDPENAALVRAGVMRLLKGRTAVVVAHDDGWAELADQVLHLDSTATSPRDAVLVRPGPQ